MIILYPIWLLLASFGILPLERFLKHRIIAQAKQKVAQFPNLIVIGITGSYGKTSVKEMLKAMLETSCTVIATPGTHNTPLGISEFILQHLTAHTEIMIVEMGAYLPGDITQLCEIVKPHIAVLTWITVQHLERFKSLERIIQTKFEITKKLTSSDFFFTDGENTAVQEGVQKYTPHTSFHIQKIWPLKVKYLPDFTGISFVFEWEEYRTKLLGKHSAKNIVLALSVAKQTMMLKNASSTHNLKEVVEKLPFVPHRLEVVRTSKTGIIVIDDSFNGNKEGVMSTIDLLRYTPFQWRKVYFTPWLVELGKKSDEVHLEIGKSLAGAVEVVLLVKNEATLKIKEGLLKAGFDEKHIQFFSTALEAHKALSSILQKGDVVVFQNDLTDNYG